MVLNLTQLFCIQRQMQKAIKNKKITVLSQLDDFHRILPESPFLYYTKIIIDSQYKKYFYKLGSICLKVYSWVKMQ